MKALLFRKDFDPADGLSKVQILSTLTRSFMEKEGNKETCIFPEALFLPSDESKKILGILYRTMKPLLEDFNPEMTNVYDECLKGIPHDTYLEPAAKLKQDYGNATAFVK